MIIMMKPQTSCRTCLVSPASVLLLLAITVVSVNGQGIHGSFPDAKNILVVPYDGSDSHFLVAKGISAELVRRGHRVTFLLQEKHRNKFTQYEDGHRYQYEYYTQGVTYDKHDEFYKNMTNAGWDHKATFETYMQWLANMTYTPYYNGIINQCAQMFLDKELMGRLQAGRFHFALVDSITICRIPQYLKIPFGAFSALPSMSSFAVYDRGLLVADPSYYPSFIDTLDTSMSFFYRLRCAISVILDYRHQYKTWWSYMNIQWRYITSYAHGKLVHRFTEADINLVNSHYVLDYQNPVLRNTFPVGGLTTRPAKPLSKEWQDFLDGSGPPGVVLFSHLKHMDAETEAVFVEAFRRLIEKSDGKVRVIWQMKGAPPSDLHDNIKVAEWVPQNDILAHPKLKVFVSQGGLNSIYEAIYHAVPMVFIPVYGDQYFNSIKVEMRGAGKVVYTLVPDVIVDAIIAMYDERKRARNQKSEIDRLSTIFSESPRRPTELAADWVEYAIRNRKPGEKQLDPRPEDWGLLQYLPRDVVTFLIVFTVILFVISVIAGVVFCRIGIMKWKDRRNDKFKNV